MVHFEKSSSYELCLRSFYTYHLLYHFYIKCGAKKLNFSCVPIKRNPGYISRSGDQEYRPGKKILQVNRPASQGILVLVQSISENKINGTSSLVEVNWPSCVDSTFLVYFREVCMFLNSSISFLYREIKFCRQFVMVW